MTDELRERIARALWEYGGDVSGRTWDAYRRADAVLAVLPRYEQVGWMDPQDELVVSLREFEDWHWYELHTVPVYIRKEPTEPNRRVQQRIAAEQAWSEHVLAPQESRKEPTDE